MISSEVERTLVKSPPELWAEISDPAALARHLSALGEIEIVRTEPEKLVEWEAEGATGTVRIKSSGWGTKVTLTACKEVSPPETRDEAPEGTQAAEAVDEPDVSGERGDAISGAEVSASEETVEVVEETDASADVEETLPDVQTLAETPPEPEPKRGFLARLFGFGRRRAGAPPSPPAQEPAISHRLPAVTDADVQPPGAAETPEPAVETTAESSEQVSSEPCAQVEPAEDLAAELRAAEEIAAEEVKAVLVAVLDRLGAAHHRPFSRA